MDNVSVSVVIPNYNGGEYLDQCIESVLFQTVRPVEIIIADDASIDCSLRIVKDWSKKYDSIRLIQSKENRGLAKNKHEAILAARGSLVTTLDSDDFYINESKLQNEISVLQQARCSGIENAIAYSQVAIVDEAGSLIRINGERDSSEGNIFFEMITRSLSFVPRDFMFTKEQYLRSGGFDLEAKLYVDWNLKLRLARENEFYCTHQLGVAYRRHGAGMSKASKSVHAKWIKHGFDNNVQHLSFGEKMKAYPLLYSRLFKILLAQMPFVVCIKRVFANR